MQMRPLLIGQAPSRSGDPKNPLTGPCGRRIAKMAGVSWFAYLRRFERANVFRRWPGKKGKGDRFPMKSARARARRMKIDLDIRLRPFTIFVGSSTARAFGVSAPVLTMDFDLDLGFVAILPHPSGINRWWNSKHNRRRAEHFFKTVLNPGRIYREPKP